MNPAPILEALATGILFGLSAGLVPGPLLALVISQTIRHGAGHGVRVAMAPLLTDVPIVVACTLLVVTVTRSPEAVGVIALVGAVVVAWLAWDTWRAEAPGTEPPSSGAAGAAPGAGVAGAARLGSVPGTTSRSPRSWSLGAGVNLLNPHPWLFWLAVGSPTLIAAWNGGGAPAVVVFLAGFYGCLVGSKVVVALLVARARGRLVGRGYTWIMRGLAALLAVFAAGLLHEGIMLVAGTA
jgi:threonine/homoserine/homoserine lactone efflux protein